MNKARCIMVIIFTLAGITVFAHGVYGKCVDECMKKCDTTIEAKFSKGEGYVWDTVGSTEYLKMKNQQKVDCYEKCEDTCTQNVKKDSADTKSKAKEKPQEK